MNIVTLEFSIFLGPVHGVWVSHSHKMKSTISRRPQPRIENYTYSLTP